MSDIKKDFEECYFRMPTGEKKIFIEKAINALAMPSSGSYLRLQLLNERLQEKLGAKFSRNFQKEVLLKLGYKRDLVDNKVVYTGMVFKKPYDEHTGAMAFINEFYTKKEDVL
jgi:hypothetical protein